MIKINNQVAKNWRANLIIKIHHLLAAQLSNNFDLIAVEEVNIHGLACIPLAK